MAALLHPTDYLDFEPEMIAAKLVAEAQEYLEDVGTPTAAAARTHLLQAQRAFHPLALDPDAVKELEQRKAGTFEDAGRRGRRALPQGNTEMQALPPPISSQRISDLEAQNAELERQLAEARGQQRDPNQ